MVAICGLVLSRLWVATLIAYPPIAVQPLSLIHSACGSGVPHRRTARSAAGALDARRDGERVLVPGRRQVLRLYVFQWLEDAEVVVLSFRGPERDHGVQRGEAGRRALQL